MPDETKRRPLVSRAANQGDQAGGEIENDDTANDARLSIPEVIPDDALGAALAYAAAGWLVGPLLPGSKSPGSVLGNDWPNRTSRDPAQIAAWFAGRDHGVFLHCRDAVVFDVDNSENLSDDLAGMLAAESPPFQSTRANDPERGHHAFQRPPGMRMSNSTKALPGKDGHAWGEIRSGNAVIVVEPTVHKNTDTGGRYEWRSTGALPPLPGWAADRLASAEIVRTEVGLSWLDELPGVTDEPCGKMRRRGDEVATMPIAGRHNHVRDGVLDLVRQAETLHPGVLAVLDRVGGSFVRAVTADGSRSEKEALDEFRRIVAGAVDIVAGSPSRDPRAALDPCLPPADVEELFLEFRAAPVSAHSADRAGSSAAISGPESEHPEPTGRTVRPPLALTRLDRFLTEPDPPVRFRIDRLMPIAGNVVLVAQFKAGKSTMVGNLARSLVDGEPFLGSFDVEPFTGSVVIIDDELSEAQFRYSLRQQKVINADRVFVIALRGRMSEFDILDSKVRARWAGMLRTVGCRVLIFDCLRPVLDALGLSEDKDAGRFLVEFDALMLDAGAEESVVVHHAGHNGERGRGDSRLRDWPDAEWKIARPGGKDETGREIDDPSAPRYFSAFGRGVEVAERALQFDPASQHLKYSDDTRKDTSGRPFVVALLEFLKAESGPVSKNKVETEFKVRGVQRNSIRGAVELAERQGWIAGGTARSGTSAGLVLTQNGLVYLATSPGSPEVRPARFQRPRHLASIGEGEANGEVGQEVETARCEVAQPLPGLVITHPRGGGPARVDPAARPAAEQGKPNADA